MRVGLNPNKDKIIKNTDFFHQVIVPVYIPNEEGYFKDSFTILQYCLNSLFKTSHAKTHFTIVNNGSCTEVIAYLNQLYKENKIQELIHTTNIGKFNAILKGITGQKFPLITITDADVLFMNNWQKETYNIFKAFPKAGVVSTTPSSKMIRYLTSNILFSKFCSQKMRFIQVKNPEAMISFAKSIENPNFYNKYHLSKYLSITLGSTSAVLGAGHFVATYNSNVFTNNSKKAYSTYKLGSAIRVFLDNPIAEKGYWRLSTVENFTYHMGNSVENWMEVYLSKIVENKNINIEIPEIKELQNSRALNFFKEKIFTLVLGKKPFWQWFLRKKGLTKEESQDY